MHEWPYSALCKDVLHVTTSHTESTCSVLKSQNSAPMNGISNRVEQFLFFFTEICLNYLA